MNYLKIVLAVLISLVILVVGGVICLIQWASEPIVMWCANTLHIHLEKGRAK